ncbi:MAG: dephospho-CoA kinase [Oscillospiraceae bacterium]
MTVVGLTGQSGSGKTAVSAGFAEAGFMVINADMLARQVMEKGQPCLEETVRHFGGEILLPDGSLDRKRLGKIVFSDRIRLDELNEICYKYINRMVEDMISGYADRGEEYVLLDAPTLFEAGEDKLCDVIVSVTADKELRLKRVTERDKISESAAEERFNSQHDLEFFRSRSDYVIENNGSLEELKNRAEDIIKLIMENSNAQKSKE